MRFILVVLFTSFSFGFLITPTHAENKSSALANSSEKGQRAEPEKTVPATEKNNKLYPFIGGQLQPIVPVEGVHPVAELEVLQALKDPSFKVVDMRTKDWRVRATIKGSLHIPYTEITERLNELGCKRQSKKWQCEKAIKVVAFCNGSTCTQSPTAIKSMVKAGYPANKIYYYRGGMQAWIIRWLTTVESP